jgi:transcriptional regulator with XRE-family HTH domain
MATNRIKVLLVEERRTGKWLAEKLGKDKATVSRWCTNSSQPPLETLADIAKLLNVDIRDLLSSTKKNVE